MDAERVKTSISGFDEMVGGGFMEGDTIMLAGGTGTGKTTFALQYLVNRITQFGDRAIFVTFEQLPDQIYRDAGNLGWDLRKMEEEDRLRLICTSPDVLLESDSDESLLDEPIRKIQPKRIVIDSLSHLAMYVEEKDLRREAYRLIMHFKARGLSSLVTWESPQLTGDAFSAAGNEISFLVDCVVLMRFVEIESALKRALVVLKMRGSDHDKRLREFEITPRGVRVIAPFSQYEGILTGAPRRSMTEAFAEAFKKRR